MSDINQEQYELQQRENCLEEIAKEIPEHYDGDTLDGFDGIVDNVWNKVVKTSETYMKYVTKDCIKEEIQEYADSLR